MFKLKKSKQLHTYVTRIKNSFLNEDESGIILSYLIIKSLLEFNLNYKNIKNDSKRKKIIAECSNLNSNLEKNVINLSKQYDDGFSAIKYLSQELDPLIQEYQNNLSEIKSDLLKVILSSINKETPRDSLKRKGKEIISKVNNEGVLRTSPYAIMTYYNDIILETFNS
jgi:hypothetical protein